MYFRSSSQHNTMEAVLQRGEKLDDLVEKSEGLTLQSKAFYKTVSKITSNKDYQLIGTYFYFKATYYQNFSYNVFCTHAVIKVGQAY